MKRKFRGCCKRESSKYYDAEDFYKAKVEETIKEINDLKKEKMKYNSGIAFVSFLSNQDLNTCLIEPLFMKKVKKNLSKKEIAALDIIKWHMKRAPS